MLQLIEKIIFKKELSYTKQLLILLSMNAALKLTPHQDNTIQYITVAIHI